MSARLINAENKNKWWALFALSAGISICAIDQSAVSVALPQMSHYFYLSQTMMQWIVNAYLLSLTVLVILGGRLSDWFAPRTVFMVGIVVFVASSITCALAQNGWDLIASRALQGVGAALVLPVPSLLLNYIFPNHQRGRAMGLYVSITLIFLLLGPIVGGLLTQYLNWRYIFWINLPVGLVGLFLAIKILPKEKVHDIQIPVDWLGFFLMMFFLVPMTIALMEAVNWGWMSERVTGLLLLALMSLITLIWVGKSKDQGFLPVNMFRSLIYRTSILLMVIPRFAMITTIFFPIYFQSILHVNAAQAGLMMLPFVGVGIIFSNLAGFLRDRFGPKLPAMLGCATLTIGALSIAILSLQNSYYVMLPALLIFGTGSTLVTPMAVTTAMTSMPEKYQASASGVAAFARQFGNLLGMTVVGAIISNFAVGHTFRFGFIIGMIVVSFAGILGLYVSRNLSNET